MDTMTLQSREKVASVPINAPSIDLAALAERANELVVAAHGVGTQRAYSSGFAHYRAWCEAHDLNPLSGDPTQIALYATAAVEMGHATSTIAVRIAAIRKA